MRSSRARLFALLATLVALLAAAAPARAHYFCHMRERVVAECCCPKEPSHRDHDGATSARAPDCCERLAAVSRAAIATTHDAAAHVPPAAIVALVPSTESDNPLREATTLATALARAPPAIGPPAFISYCRLLI